MGFFKRILKKFRKNKRHNDDLADNSRPYTPYPTYEEIQEHLKKYAPRNSNLSIPTPLSPVVEAINENGSTRSVSDFGSLLEPQNEPLAAPPSPYSQAYLSPFPRLPQSRDSYRVTVLGRVKHSSTEFPHANPAFESATDLSRQPSSTFSDAPADRGPMTPEDRNRLTKLRQDPSVASLLTVLDFDGNADPFAFSNTPGRPRTASSLKALLGTPAGLGNDLSFGGEGDLSWAERFLEERLPATEPDDLTFGKTESSIEVMRRELDRTFASFRSGNDTEEGGFSSMQAEPPTLDNESLSTPETSMHLGSDVGGGLHRTSSNSASVTFRFLLDPRHRQSSLTPSLTDGTSSAGDSPNRLPMPSPKPLPQVPRNVSSSTAGGSDMYPRVPSGTSTRTRASSLPLLSQDPRDPIDEFFNPTLDSTSQINLSASPDSDPFTTTPSRPSSKFHASRRGNKENEAPTSWHPTQVRTGIRRRSQTLPPSEITHLSIETEDSLYETPVPTRRKASLTMQNRNDVQVHEISPASSDKLSPEAQDIMSQIRRRAASTVGSFVSRSKGRKRTSDTFVAIEWER